ncbi:hypothetical protein [Parasitella parasitica]|uniref:Uncharacterized protein n=1 Tax=Parasitella parasitica TaxID=35722 RepID=A0A0B7MMM1_9FUNG|nr:hypothetical protein [Parasitella parasitica]
MGSFAYEEYGCIISIATQDFGTTFSGSCYAIVDDIESTAELSNIKNDTKFIRAADLDREIIVDIENWVENKGTKTPTVVVYDEHMHLSHWGKAATNHIAKKKNANDIVLEKFKLRLPKSVSQKGAVLVSGNREQDDEETNMRATIDFFRVVYDHIFNQIHAQRPVQTVEFSKDDIRFVITVPAIWNDVERTIMRNVAIAAGLISENDHENRLIIINESLAATLYCEREKADELLKKDVNYIICDAGGGTVDIASFVATKPDRENMSFPRCQLTADSGERCGSTYLDKRMGDLMMRTLFRPDHVDYTEDERREYSKHGFIKYTAKEREKLEVIVATLLTQFKEVGGKKYAFPAPVEAEQEERDDYAMRRRAKDDSSDESSDEESSDESPSESCEDSSDEEEKPEDPYPEDEKICYKPVSEAWYVPEQYTSVGAMLLVVPYKIMAKKIFDPVVDTTIHLLKKQIRKINGPVAATFLVGGFGQNPYLQYRIKNEFRIEENGEIVGYKCGKLLKDEKGNLAAMRGALYYGLDGSRKPTQTDIITANYYNQRDPTGSNHDGFIAEDYNTVICYDIGYDFTSCSYLDLTDKNEQERKFVFIDEWPGANEKLTRIPTAYESPEKWGAQVSDFTERKPEEFVAPSKLMSIVKGDFRRFLANFIRAMQDHVYRTIKGSGGSTDPSKFRYCITMENSYKFFFRKSEMRRVAVDAGLINAEDSTKRLLLIKREDAAAMHFESQHFKRERNKAKAFSSKFLQIFFRHDTCHLSLQEATKLSGYGDKREAILKSKIRANKDESDDNTLNESGSMDANGDILQERKSNKDEYFRNVRGVRSAIIPFNFISKLIENLKKYIDRNNCINCSVSNEHETNYDAFSPEFKQGLLSYIKTDLDFSSNEDIQQISIRKEGCCEIYVSVYDLLEHVFRPAIRDLVSDISRYSTQVDIINFRLDKIFMVGKLVEAKDATYSFLESVITKSISEVMNVGSELITTSEDINAHNHILGAQIYAEDPTTYTERVARKTYVIGIEAFKTQPFEDEILEKLERLKKEDDSKDRIYDLEAEYALKGQEPVELFYQPESNPSLKIKKTADDATLLIPRGKKVLEKDQVDGIEKKFFAHEECLVYASIYVTEKYHTDEELTNLNLNDFQKIHRFEIYIKKDPDDPMVSFENNRLHFYVRMIPDNNEVIFEASICSRIGKKIPEFRFRDEILVAQIYDDEDRIPRFASQLSESSSCHTLTIPDK